MKIKRWLWVSIIIIVLLIYSIFGYIRSIKITVVDSLTKKPLENVLVYYMLEGMRSELLAFDGPDYRRFETQTLITNKDGKVYFKQLFFIKYFAESFDETIAINIDTKETQFTYMDMKSGQVIYIPKNKSDDPSYNFFSHHSGVSQLDDWKNMVFNPNSDYYGLIILSSDGYDYAKENAGGNKFVKHEKYTLFWNDYSLGKLFMDEITVNLEPKKK